MELICLGIKNVENRTWKPKNYCGRILIHAARRWDDRARVLSLLFTPDQWKTLPDRLQKRLAIQTDFSTSAIIGEVTVKEYIKDSPSVWAESGAVHWVLQDAKIYKQLDIGKF